jgi:hypothetical protein
MKTFSFFVLLVACSSLTIPARSQEASGDGPPEYKVKRLTTSLAIDAHWNKKAWRKVKPAVISNFIREVPAFRPVTEVKMQYDDENIYVIFRVHDRYVRSLTNSVGGPVWKDAAVELFFCPDTTRPTNYFNLEINCGGTALLGYREKKPTEEDIKKIVIAHSLPQIVNPEITDPVVWTLEYSIPLNMLEKYAAVTRPAKGVKWKANFAKIAENNSNPHHMTWSPITAPKPNFHMPQYFGTLTFE